MISVKNSIIFTFFFIVISVYCDDTSVTESEKSLKISKLRAQSLLNRAAIVMQSMDMERLNETYTSTTPKHPMQTPLPSSSASSLLPIQKTTTMPMKQEQNRTMSSGSTSSVYPSTSTKTATTTEAAFMISMKPATDKPKDASETSTETESKLEGNKSDILPNGIPGPDEIIVLKPVFFFLRDKIENLNKYFPSTGQQESTSIESINKDTFFPSEQQQSPSLLKPSQPYYYSEVLQHHKVKIPFRQEPPIVYPYEGNEEYEEEEEEEEEDPEPFMESEQIKPQRPTLTIEYKPDSYFPVRGRPISSSVASQIQLQPTIYSNGRRYVLRPLGYGAFPNPDEYQ